MTTPNAEAIKTLEKMLDDLRFQRRVSETSMLNGIETAIEAAIDALKDQGTRLPDHMDTQANTRASMQPVVPVSPPGTGQLFPAGPPPAECRVFEYLKNHPRMSLGWQTGYGWFVVDFYSKDPAIMGHDVDDLAAQLERKT